MKNNYISAMNKITASDNLREKTLAAMKQAQMKPAAKTIKFNKKFTVIAACAVFALCIPAMAYLLDFNSMFGAKSAAPQMMPEQQNTQPEAMINDEAGAMPKAAVFDAKTSLLSEEQATELVLEGAAFIDGGTEAGGYETQGLVINSVTQEAETNAYKFEATDKNGNKLILYVY